MPYVTQCPRNRGEKHEKAIDFSSNQGYDFCSFGKHYGRYRRRQKAQNNKSHILSSLLSLSVPLHPATQSPDTPFPSQLSYAPSCDKRIKDRQRSRWRPEAATAAGLEAGRCNHCTSGTESALFQFPHANLIHSAASSKPRPKNKPPSCHNLSPLIQFVSL